MRCSNIRIRFEIPICVNSKGLDPLFEQNCYRDRNGNIYTIDAIAGACESAVNAPIIQYDSDGHPVPIGIVEKAVWNPKIGRIEVDGKILYGGTCERTILSSANEVVSMEIESFGFCQ